MGTSLRNFAYIDANNLYRGISSLGWRLDFKRFRRFLADRHGVGRAYLFIGFIPENAGLYRDLEEWGYVVVFKATTDHHGKVKGNCDGELIVQAMNDLFNVAADPDIKIVIVTGDGDFACLVNYLESKNKLKIILSPTKERCSALLKRATAKITYLEQMKNKLVLNEKAPIRDGPK